MAESGVEPAGAAGLTSERRKEEAPVPAESVAKELLVTVVTGTTLGSDGPPPAGIPEEEEATPTPPESSLSLSSENETLTFATTEEESLLRTNGDADRGGTPDLDLDLDPEETSSVVTAGGSDDQRESSDSASFSIPSLELSDGVAATGNSLDVEDGLSSSFSVPGGDVVPRPTVEETPEAAGGAAAAAGSDADPSTPAYYLVKWITWKEKKTPIITQSENGPCPLLAIMNTLFLRWKANLPAQTEVVTTEDLMTHLGECVLSVTPRENADGMELNFQQNVSDAMAVLPKLSTGLDVNVRFAGVSDFEYTPECIVFDLLDIPLYHGWLADPQSPEVAASVGKLSYNQLVEKIIDCKHSADSSRVSEGLVAEQFLESTATQLSYHGLCELNTTAKEGEISVFFRNNHFSTMIKHQGHLYLLVTDQGFLQEEGLIWESLHNVEGDGNFCDSDFRLRHPPQRAPPPSVQPPSTQEQQRQIDQVRGQGSQPGGARRRDKDSDCVVL
ncbi:ubiquitin carboxyl-terminal hydrolase MINDY-1 isoform X2 [Brachionichthys hirsutus]|uniref:ubiquitin carboxyl-terminal hydrolase MINDY-1 isoform X2 n=1 Tax=Brachionichthys hirsutus TaxID=412623 RepID=UPI003604EE73